MESKVIAVDFDGTLCENKWPYIGEPNEELILFLKKERIHDTKLILWTCREGEILNQAVEWCKERGLEFDAVNENLPEIIEQYGGNCRKISADEYIDDKMCTRFKLSKEKDWEMVKPGTVIKIGQYQGYDLIPKYGLPPLPEGSELVVLSLPNSNNKKHSEKRKEHGRQRSDA